MSEIKNSENSQAIDEIQNEIYSRMSFAQKWETAQQLKEIAWTLKSAGVRSLHPEWNEREVQAEVRKIFLYATT
jgi:hypothetical protein